ncbi:unnamed protein product [Anisakis simplex]|uniref:PH domain-containing protein n=1 Tax=Anisakis simplex TaxID=6269 RepID=A0A0M3K4K0_ANISI|nr:unnamed protein product [Anisakis simplex]
MLKPRKRMFFALEETQNQLTFFKDESDFVKRKEPVGTIPLANAACTVAEQSGTSFAIHANGRTYGFDADNERSAEHWMSALQNRRESVDLNENIRKTSRPLSRRPPKMSRSRSASLPSESELQSAQRTQRYTLEHRRSVAPFPRVLPTDVEARDDIGVVDKERVEGKGDRLPSWFDEWIRSWLNDQSFSVPPYGTEKTNITEASVTTEELYRLREITNRQKERIQELNENNKKLIVQMSQLREFQLATLIAQNKFLNAEVLRLSERSEAEQRVIEKLKTEKRNLEEDINGFRREYVFLLQSCIRIPLSEQHSTDVLQVKLLGGDIELLRSYPQKIYGAQSFSLQPEARRLVRGGIPPSMRTTVWRMIIHQQVADVKKKYGKYYYRNLCNSQGTPAERQVHLIVSHCTLRIFNDC